MSVSHGKNPTPDRTTKADQTENQDTPNNKATNTTTSPRESLIKVGLLAIDLGEVDVRPAYCWCPAAGGWRALHRGA